MFIKHIVGAVWIVLFVFCFAWGQDTTPKLTEVQKLQIQNAALRVETAHVRLQLAQVDFERQREALNTLIKSLQVHGYALELDRLTYVADEPKPKPPE